MSKRKIVVVCLPLLLLSDVQKTDIHPGMGDGSHRWENQGRRGNICFSHYLVMLLGVKINDGVLGHIKMLLHQKQLHQTVTNLIEYELQRGHQAGTKLALPIVVAVYLNLDRRPSSLQEISLPTHIF